jgi:hypothetical protein
MKTVEERFWSKVAKFESCWIWNGAKDETGHGRLKINCIQVSAHRVSYEWKHGSIPDGMDAHHKCFNPACVNPDHLQILTHSQHISLHRPFKTHCKRGHEFTPDNLYNSKSGKKKCIKCSKINGIIRRDKRRVAKAIHPGNGT